VNEPGHRFKRIGLQDLALSFPGNLERHRNILATSRPSRTLGVQQMASVMLQVGGLDRSSVLAAFRV
jgi:hypothetical protein